MFGYVRPYRPELTLRQDALYRAHYCGVCHALSAYGLPYRSLLRYDLTFLSVVRCGLEAEEPQLRPRLCPARLRRLPSVQGESAALCAGLHLLLAMEQCRDDGRDGGAHALLAPLLRPGERRAAERFPGLQAAILEMDRAQTALERAGCAEPEEASEPFSQLCQSLFAYGADGKQAPALGWMGRNLGRWIYLVDALDDYRADQKRGCYNVLLRRGWSRSQAVEALTPLLGLLADQALAAWDSLEPARNDGLVRNVLELGLAHTANNVAEERREPDGPL